MEVDSLVYKSMQSEIHNFRAIISNMEIMLRSDEYNKKEILERLNKSLESKKLWELCSLRQNRILLNIKRDIKVTEQEIRDICLIVVFEDIYKESLGKYLQPVKDKFQKYF